MFARVPVYKQEKVIWEYIYFRVIFQYQYHEESITKLYDCMFVFKLY